MDPLTLGEISSVLAGKGISLPANSYVRRVSTDSRDIRPGDLFWALRGEQFDGHDFVPQALAQGAVAAVVDQSQAHRFELPRVVVDSTLPALSQLAAWYRSQHEALIVGVTGSVGKTTTREMIYAVLAEKYCGLRSRKNFNNEVGLPLSLLDLTTDHEFAVLELGAARVGDIQALCATARPEAGVITRIGPAHLRSFGSLEAIYQGKGELLESLPCTGFAIVGGDDPLMRKMAERASCQTTLIGEGPENHLRATEIEFTPGRLRFKVDRNSYDVSVPARHYLVSALAAIAVGREIGMEASEIAAGLHSFVSPPSRCQVTELADVTLIDDTYNASPLSMQAACECLGHWPTRGERIFIMGDMLELGNESVAMHVDLGRQVAESAVDRLVVVGEHASHVVRGAREAGFSMHQIAVFKDLEPMLPLLDCWLQPGDTVLVKGSRGMRMERVVDWLRNRSPNPDLRSPTPINRAA